MCLARSIGQGEKQQNWPLMSFPHLHHCPWRTGFECALRLAEKRNATSHRGAGPFPVSSDPFNLEQFFLSGSIPPIVLMRNSEPVRLPRDRGRFAGTRWLCTRLRNGGADLGVGWQGLHILIAVRSGIRAAPRCSIPKAVARTSRYPNIRHVAYPIGRLRFLWWRGYTFPSPWDQAAANPVLNAVHAPNGHAGGLHETVAYRSVFDYGDNAHVGRRPGHHWHGGARRQQSDGGPDADRDR